MAARPDAVILPAASSASTRPTFLTDHALLGPRRVIRWKELSSSRFLACPSIQPKAQASCTAAS